MTTKTIEIRDRGTFIPALAIRLDPGSEADRYLLGRAGYGTSPETQKKYVTLMRINGGNGEAHCDPHDWPSGTRTFQVAHEYIIENFDALESGEVVDVEFILGETTAPKLSEAESSIFIPLGRST
jgi:hypothetical protein